MTGTATALESPEQVLEFALGEQRYCVDIDDVEEIVRADELTTLPESPPQVAGIMNLRGETTTILDLTHVFGVQAAGASQQVVIIDGPERIGWLVDSVREVNTLREVDVDPAEESPHVSGLINDDGFVLWIEPETVQGSVPA